MTRPGCSDAALVRRSRYGDRRAARQLAARYLERVSTLATVVAPTRPEQLARAGFGAALTGPGPFSDSLVRAFGALAGRAPDAERAQGRLLVLLVDLEHRPLEEAADLVGLPVAQAEERRSSVGSLTGALGVGKACHGWGLASGRRDLTDAERAAGDDHLALCRRCREHRAALEHEQRELLTRAAGVAGVLGAGQAGALALVPAGGLLAGKAVIGVIGALGATALATGGLAAGGELPVGPGAAPSAPPAQPSTTAPWQPPTGCAAPCSPPAPATGPLPTTSSAPAPATGQGVPTVRLPASTGSGLDVPSLPLPTPLPTSVPLPLPSSVTVLPSTSPVPLPTSLQVPPLLP